MNTYIILLRGINVGGKNKLSMVSLRRFLQELGFVDVLTYIASGNVILKSDKDAKEVEQIIEAALPRQLKIDSELIKILVITPDELQVVVSHKPSGFGEQPDKHHSDVIFLMGIKSADVIDLFKPKEGVDKIWSGDGVIYSQRLSALRVKSRLSAIMTTSAYKSMTIRTWNTAIKLLALARSI